MNYRMKDVIANTGLTEKTIRYYINKSLVSPIEIESNGRKNYYFTEEHIRQLKEIAVLRYYDFSVQEVHVILNGNVTDIRNILNRYVKCNEERNRLVACWENKIEEIDDKSKLVELLNESKEKAERECIYQLKFENEDGNENVAEDDIKEHNSRFTAAIFLTVFSVLLCICVGFGIGKMHEKNINKRANTAGLFKYGVVESNITVDQIIWTEFPGWHNVSCEISGYIKVNIPKGNDIEVDGLSDKDCLQELERESKIISNGDDIIYFDQVEYEFNRAKIIGKGICNSNENEIASATTSFKLYIKWNGEEKYCLGNITLNSSEFTEWSQLQNQYTVRDLTPYLDAFSLSRTYADKQIAKNVSLSKMAGGMLNCLIKNEGTERWRYSADLPSLEMWYDGIWIELKTPWASSAMLESCSGYQEKQIEVPSPLTDKYPYLIPGLYRLVIYGMENDYIATEYFEIKEK